MSVFTTRPAMRWLVPGVTAIAVVGGGLVARTAAAAADPSLPPRTAAQLLVDLQTAKLDGLSGTVVQHADLGLPSIPNTGGQGSSDLSSLITGDHTLRVWYSGPDKARVALLGTLGESDIIRNGKDVWTWDSKANTASHRTLNATEADAAAGAGAGAGVKDHAGGLPKNVPSTPQEAADLALRSIDPTTVVTTAGSARVAGRSAYELVVAPRDRASLIGQVRLAIDAKQHVPLRVQVFAKGSSKAAIDVAFTQIGFARPNDSQFRFAPPPGVKVTEESADQQTAPDGKDVAEGKSAHITPGTEANPGTDAKPRTDAAPVVIGTGWTSVIVAQVPANAMGSAPGGQPGGTDRGRGADTADNGLGALNGVLAQLPTVRGSWGSGRVLSAKLFSVLLTDDGRVLAGAVSPDRLYQAAADPKAIALKAGK